MWESALNLEAKMFRGWRFSFTLVGLLVNSTIIGILSTLLLYVLSGTKERERSLFYQANLHRIGLTVALSGGETGHLSSSWRIHRAVGIDNCVWPERSLSRAGDKRNIFSCSSAPPDSVWNIIQNNTLGSYLDMETHFSRSAGNRDLRKKSMAVQSTYTNTQS